MVEKEDGAVDRVATLKLLLFIFSLTWLSVGRSDACFLTLGQWCMAWPLNERTSSLWVWVYCKFSYPISLGSLQPVLTKSTHPAEFAEDCILGLVWPFWQIKGCAKPWNVSYLQQNFVVSIGCSPTSLPWITEVVSVDGLSNFIMNLHPFKLKENPSHQCTLIGHYMSSF